MATGDSGNERRNMTPAPKIRDTQDLYTVVGNMAAKVDNLHESQPEIFRRLNAAEKDVATHKEFCRGVQNAKKERSKVVTAILATLISAAILACAGAGIAMYRHVSEPVTAVTVTK